MTYLNVNFKRASFFASHKHIFSTSTQQQIRYLFDLQSELMLKMQIQDITLFGLLSPAIPLKMVAVNFRYTALAGLIRQIHQMARHTGEQTRPPTILYREVRMLETRNTFVKFSFFFWFILSFQSSGCGIAYFKCLFYVSYAVHCYISQLISGHSLISL